MSATISQEKIDGLRALAGDRGVIAAVGVDQRGSLQRALAGLKGMAPEDVEDETIRELKLAVSKALSPHASAIVLDPERGLPAAEARAQGVGLLLRYEQSGQGFGEAPALTSSLSARRLKELGADAAKLLLRYTPFDDAEVNDSKLALVERVGAECRAEGIPLFLMLAGADETAGAADDRERAVRRPAVVTESVRELSKERYGVDLLGVELPVDLRFVRGSSVFTGAAAYEKARALDHLRAAAEAARRPFVYIGAGATSAELAESLHWAAEAGVNFCGALGGRAIWADGLAVFAERGEAAFEEWLEDHGVRNMDALNAALANAGTWYSFYGAGSAEALAP